MIEKHLFGSVIGTTINEIIETIPDEINISLNMTPVKNILHTANRELFGTPLDRLPKPKILNISTDQGFNLHCEIVEKDVGYRQQIMVFNNKGGKNNE